MAGYSDLLDMFEELYSSGRNKELEAFASEVLDEIIKEAADNDENKDKTKDKKSQLLIGLGVGAPVGAAAGSAGRALMIPARNALSAAGLLSRYPAIKGFGGVSKEILTGAISGTIGGGAAGAAHGGIMDMIKADKELAGEKYDPIEQGRKVGLIGGAIALPPAQLIRMPVGYFVGNQIGKRYVAQEEDKTASPHFDSIHKEAEVADDFIDYMRRSYATDLQRRYGPISIKGNEIHGFSQGFDGDFITHGTYTSESLNADNLDNFLSVHRDMSKDFLAYVIARCDEDPILKASLQELLTKSTLTDEDMKHPVIQKLKKEYAIKAGLLTGAFGGVLGGALKGSSAAVKKVPAIAVGAAVGTAAAGIPGTLLGMMRGKRIGGDNVIIDRGGSTHPHIDTEHLIRSYFRKHALEASDILSNLEKEAADEKRTQSSIGAGVGASVGGIGGAATGLALSGYSAATLRNIPPGPLRNAAAATALIGTPLAAGTGALGGTLYGAIHGKIMDKRLQRHIDLGKEIEYDPVKEGKNIGLIGGFATSGPIGAPIGYYVGKRIGEKYNEQDVGDKKAFYTPNMVVLEKTAEKERKSHSEIGAGVGAGVGGIGGATVGAGTGAFLGREFAKTETLLPPLPRRVKAMALGGAAAGSAILGAAGAAGGALQGLVHGKIMDHRKHDATISGKEYDSVKEGKNIGLIGGAVTSFPVGVPVGYYVGKRIGEKYNAQNQENKKSASYNYALQEFEKVAEVLSLEELEILATEILIELEKEAVSADFKEFNSKINSLSNESLAVRRAHNADYKAALANFQVTHGRKPSPEEKADITAQFTERYNKASDDFISAYEALEEEEVKKNPRFFEETMSTQLAAPAAAGYGIGAGVGLGISGMRGNLPVANIVKGTALGTLGGAALGGGAMYAAGKYMGRRRDAAVLDRIQAKTASYSEALEELEKAAFILSPEELEIMAADILSNLEKEAVVGPAAAKNIVNAAEGVATKAAKNKLPRKAKKQAKKDKAAADAKAKAEEAAAVKRGARDSFEDIIRAEAKRTGAELPAGISASGGAYNPAVAAEAAKKALPPAANPSAVSRTQNLPAQTTRNMSPEEHARVSLTNYFKQEEANMAAMRAQSQTAKSSTAAVPPAAVPPAAVPPNTAGNWKAKAKASAGGLAAAGGAGIAVGGGMYAAGKASERKKAANSDLDYLIEKIASELVEEYVEKEAFLKTVKSLLPRTGGDLLPTPNPVKAVASGKKKNILTRYPVATALVGGMGIGAAAVPTINAVNEASAAAVGPDYAKQRENMYYQ